jgi:hypothetical protein
VKERPILMSAPMVRGTLREVDPKTQTRRVVKPAPHHAYGGQLYGPPDGSAEPDGAASGYPVLHCPYGRPGDRLWVRETWTWLGGMTDGTRPVGEYHHLYVKYQADGEKRTITPNGFVKTPTQPPQRDGEVYSLRDAPDDFQYDGENTYMDRLSRWWQRKIPAIHMYRWASRITLEITEVRVERLQDISDSDAWAEGISASTVSTDEPGDAVRLYRALWESINGPGSWDENPWVWAISFRRIAP